MQLNLFYNPPNIKGLVKGTDRRKAMPLNESFELIRREENIHYLINRSRWKNC